MKTNELFKAMRKALMSLALAAAAVAGLGSVGCNEPEQPSQAIADFLGVNARPIAALVPVATKVSADSRQSVSPKIAALN